MKTNQQTAIEAIGKITKALKEQMQAIDLMKELKPEKAYFTHISHQLGLHEQVSKELPAFIELAYDGLQIEI